MWICWCKSAAMPGSSSLTVEENDVIYRSTTTAGNSPGMLDTVKKAFSFVSSSPLKGKRLIAVSKSPVILPSRYRILSLFLFRCLHCVILVAACAKLRVQLPNMSKLYKKIYFFIRLRVVHNNSLLCEWFEKNSFLYIWFFLFGDTIHYWDLHTLTLFSACLLSFVRANLRYYIFSLYMVGIKIL